MSRTAISDGINPTLIEDGNVLKVRFNHLTNDASLYEIATINFRYLKGRIDSLMRDGSLSAPQPLKDLKTNFNSLKPEITTIDFVNLPKENSELAELVHILRSCSQNITTILLPDQNLSQYAAIIFRDIDENAFGVARGSRTFNIKTKPLEREKPETSVSDHSAGALGASKASSRDPGTTRY